MLEQALMALFVDAQPSVDECEDARHFRDHFVTRKNQMLFALIGATNRIMA